MTKTEMRTQLRMIAERLDVAQAQNGGQHSAFDAQMAVRALMVVVQWIGDAVLPVGPGEAPQAVEAPQDVLQLAASPTSAFEPGYVRQRQEPAPVAIVTDDDRQVRALAIVADDQVRTFAREWQGRGNAGVATLLFNAAHTIETLSRDLCEARKKIARLEQEALPPRWR